LRAWTIDVRFLSDGNTAQRSGTDPVDWEMLQAFIVKEIKDKVVLDQELSILVQCLVKILVPRPILHNITLLSFLLASQLELPFLVLFLKNKTCNIYNAIPFLLASQSYRFWFFFEKEQNIDLIKALFFPEKKKQKVLLLHRRFIPHPGSR
jgi:hypothetical protein